MWFCRCFPKVRGLLSSHLVGWHGGHVGMNQLHFHTDQSTEVRSDTGLCPNHSAKQVPTFAYAGS